MTLKINSDRYKEMTPRRIVTALILLGIFFTSYSYYKPPVIRDYSTCPSPVLNCTEYQKWDTLFDR